MINQTAIPIEDKDIDRLNLLQRLDLLESSLPKDLHGHLKFIHETLQSRPELVHILSDENAAKLVSGQGKLVAVSLTVEATKAKGRKKMTEDDLF